MAKKSFYFLLLFIFVVLYFMLIYTGLTSSDYLLYSFKFSMMPQENAPWPLVHEKVTSFGDIIYSQYVHYFFVNGRSIIHTIVQVFTSFMRYDICCVIATIVYVVTLILAEKVCFKSNKYSWEPLFVIIVGIFTFCCDPAANFLMVTAINYLWPITICLLFIIMINSELGTVKRWLFFLVAFISGWSHEAIAVPLSTAFFFYLIFNKKELESYQIIGIVLLFLGTIITVLAPGNFVKFFEHQQAPDAMILIKQHLYLIVYLRLFYVLMVALLYLAAKRKLWQFINENKYWFIALVASFVFVFMAGVINPRSTFFIEMIAGGILCILIDDYMARKYRNAIIAFLAVVIIPLSASAVYYRGKIKKSIVEAERKIEASQEKVVTVEITRVNTPCVVKPLVSSVPSGQRERYVGWDNTVYEFVYSKEDVNIIYVDIK